MITAQDYQARRHQLAQRMGPNTIAIIPAAKEILRNGDAHYRFRQQSDFFYLTGFLEPDAVLVMVASPMQSILFSRPNNPSEEQWTGKRLGQTGAIEQLGMDQAYPIEELDKQLPMLLANKTAIVYAIGQDMSWDRRIISALARTKKQARAGVTSPEGMLDLAPMMGEMRVIKSATEVSMMREAARITVAAHQRAMRACLNARYEYELEAELLYEFTRQGCRAPAYDSIVACGENACTLHYTANNQALTPGDLVLIDAGAEFESYAADVTRTFPVNGVFSTEQRLIYTLVLQAQHAGIAAIKPGATWDAAQRAIVTVITQGLVDLGLLTGVVGDLIAAEAYKPFYMHNSGHWLGLDVHDCGRYKNDGVWRTLEPGMVLTVEPGIYISKQTPGVEPRWWGIGVRIEDDILVTEEGSDNLTAALMREVSDIEAFMRG